MAQVDRGLVLGWLIAVLAVVIAVSPVAVVGYSQLHQIHWIQPPGLKDLLTLQRLFGRTSLVLATVVVVAAAVGYRLARGRPLGGCWPGRLVALCLPWLILPPVILLTASLAHPVYTFRYIVFCIPAAALLIGPALVALGRYAGHGRPDRAAGDRAAHAGLPAQRGRARHQHPPGGPDRGPQP